MSYKGRMGKSSHRSCKGRSRITETGKVCLKEIIKVLEEEAACNDGVATTSKRKQPKTTCRPPKAPAIPLYESPCRRRPKDPPPIPMTPSLGTRLQFIRHCPREPYVKERPPVIDEPCIFCNDDATRCQAALCRRAAAAERRRLRHTDEGPCGIRIAPPVTMVKHSPSDKEIITLTSPKMSGEFIQVQKAIVRPWSLAPLPAKSGHELFKPHSGILINNDPDWVPEGAAAVPGRPTRVGLKKRPCRKGGICSNRDCRTKKCRRRAILRRKRLAARRLAMSDADGGAPYVRAGAKHGRPCGSAKRFNPDPDSDPCGLDDIPRQEQVKIPRDLKKGSFKTHSMTVLPCKKNQVPIGQHYGILMGTRNMYSDKFGPKSKGRQALTMSVMAYCLAFHYHPKQWSMKLIDNLLDAGDQWYMQLLEKVHDHAEYQGMCEVMPFGKKQVLLLNRKRMQVLLCEPEIVGYAMSKDPTVYNLCKGLRAFFADNRAGILMTRSMKVVIWRDKICYYIFDPAGRNSKAYSNYTNGVAALINVKDIAAVGEILLTRSNLEDQKFVLVPVKVLRMVPETADDDLEEEKELSHSEKAKMSYRILDENCAIVNANMHLGDRVFEDAKWRQSLPIAIAALTYAKISPPNTWYSKTLDKIIRFGNKLYLDCSDPKALVDLTIDNIPNEISIGPFWCEIIIYRERVKGQLFTTKECLFNIRTGLEEFFSKEYSGGLLEFHNHFIAFWKQKDMFYMFDPFPRTNDGGRTKEFGKGCCFMFLNTDTLAKAFITIWDYLPPSTIFYMHPFKVLKLKKKTKKTNIKCSLSDSSLPGAKVRRKVLHSSQSRGDANVVTLMAADDAGSTTGFISAGDAMRYRDEEQLGDIVSLVESIQDGFLPPIPIKYKNMPPESVEPKIVSLDSPTVSVTQIIPPWPKPRDKTNEPPEPDPEYEPTPPPTPPPPPPPEGVEEEEEAEEELDEEMLAEMERRKAEEEEERRRQAERLPPPLPPPPPTPQDQEEVPLAVMDGVMIGPGGTGKKTTAGPGGGGLVEDEILTMEPVKVHRKVLLTEDAKKRYAMRQTLKKITPPLNEESCEETCANKEIEKPHNFKTLMDSTQIIQGTTAVQHQDSADILPFTAIMAIITSYKYTLNTWTPHIVDFIVDGGTTLYQNKKEKFQLAPLHIIPKIGIGQQAYHANIDVVGEGASWQMEDVLNCKFFPRFDRGIITMHNYACAVFYRNGLFYMFDGSQCSAMGLRDPRERVGIGKACFLRFRTLHDLVARINYNKDGNREDQQFILSRVLVRRLLVEPRQQLPEDYDYAIGRTSSRAKPEYVDQGMCRCSVVEAPDECENSPPEIGYHLASGMYRIEGTTAVGKSRTSSSTVSKDHFVCLIAMLMATMHPIRTWDHTMVDSCIEKGLEIFSKAKNLSPCEKRVIRNIIVDGKFININIKKIIVINENKEKTLEQYMTAVMNRLRYVIVRFPSCSMVVCRSDGYYHLFDPYPYPLERPLKKDLEFEKQRERELSAERRRSGEKISTEEKKEVKQEKEEEKQELKEIKDQRKELTGQQKAVASWTLYRDLEKLIGRIRVSVKDKAANEPEFYTFELTSVKTAPRRCAINYRLSPLFRPDQNPNAQYLKRRPLRPLVDEKMYWLNIDSVPWSRMNAVNDLGLPRRTPRTMWKDWDIEFPGDLFSLWGTIHPLDRRFSDETRGKQYLATCVVALVMSRACCICAWTSSILDGIVIAGDKYHERSCEKYNDRNNMELQVEDLNKSFDDMYPYEFSVKFEKKVFGFVYNVETDRFNLSQALAYFFEKNTLGLLVSPVKNLAFGKTDSSYFMFDCQSHGIPLFSPGQGAAYILKCESINRLVYCMTITLNIHKHGQLFHLYSLPSVTINSMQLAKCSPCKKCCEC